MPKSNGHLLINTKARVPSHTDCTCATHGPHYLIQLVQPPPCYLELRLAGTGVHEDVPRHLSVRRRDLQRESLVAGGVLGDVSGAEGGRVGGDDEAVAAALDPCLVSGVGQGDVREAR